MCKCKLHSSRLEARVLASLCHVNASGSILSKLLRDQPVEVGGPQGRGSSAARLIGGRAPSVKVEPRLAAGSAHCSGVPPEAQCLVSLSTSEMSGSRCHAGTLATPSSGSDRKLLNVTSRTNQTTAVSPQSKTLASSCAGARVWVCWTRMTPSRMY